MPDLRTEDFPQADSLRQVGLVAVAVSEGHTSDAAIERFIGLHSENRQGRYYRKAAEILGLVTRTGANESALTPAGSTFVGLSRDSDRKAFLARRLRGNRVFRRVTQYIAERKPGYAELVDHVVGLYPGSATTARRRVSTITAFLAEAGLARVESGRYVPGPLAGDAVVQRERDDAGLFGRPVPKDGATDEPLIAKPPYKIEVDAAKAERANRIHQKLVVAKAAFLEQRDFPANQNDSIDLFSESKGKAILYEMKSITNSNFSLQVRRAISQLYEYRYIFGVRDARLCIVTNDYPEQRSQWYLEYLQKDRGIAYVWTEDFVSFVCEPASTTLLGPFSP